MANKITAQIRQTCLQLAAASADRESPTDVVSRALTYEQYLSGEVSERIALANAVDEVEFKAPEGE